MTQEEMSGESAHRAETRMRNEAKNSVRIVNPPRMSPPLCARENLDTRRTPVSETTADPVTEDFEKTKMKTKHEEIIKDSATSQEMRKQ